MSNTNRFDNTLFKDGDGYFKSDINNYIFCGCEFKYVDLNKINIINTQFVDCRFLDFKVSHIIIDNAIIRSCTFNGSLELSEVSLQNSLVENSIIIELRAMDVSVNANIFKNIHAKKISKLEWFNWSKSNVYKYK